jgi:hypothetical protein
MLKKFFKKPGDGAPVSKKSKRWDIHIFTNLQISMLNGFASAA